MPKNLHQSSAASWRCALNLHLLRWRKFYSLIVFLSLVAALLVAGLAWVSDRNIERLKAEATSKGFREASAVIFANTQVFDFYSAKEVCEVLLLRPTIVGVTAGLIDASGDTRIEICKLGDVDGIALFPLRETRTVDGAPGQSWDVTAFTNRADPKELFVRSVTKGIVVFFVLLLLLLIFALLFVRVSIYPELQALLETMRLSATTGRHVKTEEPAHFLGQLTTQYNNMQEALEQEGVERKRIASRLTSSEHQLRVTLDAIEYAIFATNKNGHVVLMSAVAKTWVKQLAGAPFSTPTKALQSLFPHDDLTPYSISEMEQLNVVWSRPRAVSLKDGSTRWLSISATPIIGKAENIEGAVVVLRDVTNEIETQQKLFHSEKMHAIGQLAAGIAHDFNNVLSAVSSSAVVVRERLGESNDRHITRGLDVITRSSERAAELIKKLLIFTGDHGMELSTINLCKLLEDVVEIMEATADSRVSFEITGKTDAFALGNMAALENALINLCINSCHSMDNKGRVSLGLAVIQSTDALGNGALVLAPPAEDDGGRGYVAASVSDTGSGIPTDIIKQIFDPFFTTRKAEGGTGLGLPAVYSTMEALDGGIFVASRIGSGTTVTLLFPRQDAVESKMSVASDVQEPVRGHHILVVEDDPELGVGVQLMLETMGHSVSLFKNGPEAIEFFKTEHQRVDVILLDLNLPNMNGEKIVLELSKIAPDCRIIMYSGLGTAATLSEDVRLRLTGFLSKPFRMEELSAAISTALRTAPGTSSE